MNNELCLHGEPQLRLGYGNLSNEMPMARARCHIRQQSCIKMFVFDVDTCDNNEMGSMPPRMGDLQCS